MSLFNILKYGNTDLSSISELSDLPNKLIDLYWEKSWTGKRSTGSVTPPSIWHLTFWYIRTPDTQIRLFKETLKEYNNEHL